MLIAVAELLVLPVVVLLGLLAADRYFVSL